MVVVGLVIILVLCVVMLCCVRPRQDADGHRRRRKQPLTLPPYSGVLTPSSVGSNDYSGFPSDHGWIPNQPPVVGKCCYNYVHNSNVLYRRELMITKLFYKEKELDIIPHARLSNGLTHSGKMIMSM